VRLFIAIELVEEIKNEIEDQVKRLKRMGGNIRWVKREAMHLTLKFLGEVNEDRLGAIEKAMDRAVSDFTSFEISVEGCGTFPVGSARPRVLWIGVKEPKILIALQEKLEEELLTAGFQKETRAFHPHVTLGRVKGTSALRRIVEEMKSMEGYQFGSMEVDRIILFRSRLTPDGPIYTKIYEARLR